MKEVDKKLLFAMNLQDYMTISGKTRSDLSTDLQIPYSTLSEWLQAKKYPRMESLYKLAEYFNISVASLIEEDRPGSLLPVPHTTAVPVVGTIACGSPICANENYGDRVQMPEYIHADFALRCQGDSMINARIYDGDIVYIRKQPVVENGEIAAVLIDNDATLKRVYVYNDRVVLEPENPMYRPLVYWGQDRENIRIIGKAIAFTSMVRIVRS